MTCNIRKSRGYTFEKYVCKYLEEKEGYGKSIRLGQPHQPDVLFVNRKKIIIVECKSGAAKTLYVKQPQIQLLCNWCDIFHIRDEPQIILAFRFKTGAKTHVDYFFEIPNFGLCDYKCTINGELYKKLAANNVKTSWHLLQK